MTKLNQIIAILNGVKSTAAAEKTAVHQLVQKQALFQGVSRTYAPREEEGYVYPAESQTVQVNAARAIESFIAAMSALLDTALTQDAANTEAKADIVIGANVIAADVPVTYLLFLEKQIGDIRTFVNAIPVLSIDKDWTYDRNKGTWVSTPRETTKTKKTTKFVVAYDATPEHPAQIREVTEDVVEGTWTTIDMSGALPQDEKLEIVKRVEALHQAIIKAREAANSIEVQQKQVAGALFGYLFDTMPSSTN
jgi:hypothetical protein